MAEYVPAARLRDRSAGVAAAFSARLHDTLTLAELAALFDEHAALEGMLGHACVAVATGAQLLGRAAPPAAGPLAVLSFPVEGWDGAPYRVDYALPEGGAEAVRRAELHTLAALCVARAIALSQAQDDPAPDTLTATERHCLEQRRLGRCDLDIGEELGRSAQAVRIHLDRADRKLRPALSGR